MENRKSSKRHPRVAKTGSSYPSTLGVKGKINCINPEMVSVLREDVSFIEAVWSLLYGFSPPGTKNMMFQMKEIT